MADFYCDQMMMPQPAMELCAHDKNREVTRYNKNDVTICIDPAAIEYKGEIATFLVTVLFRQSASWQGTVLWVEGKKSEDFRSVLDLLKLITSLRGEEACENLPRAALYGVQTKRKTDDQVFCKEPFYITEINCGSFSAFGDKLMDKSKAESICTSCDGQPAIVLSVERQSRMTHPPCLFNMTTLQRETNRLYNFTAKQTTVYLQNLYEKNLITSPYTNSRYLTDEMRSTVGSIINYLQMTMPFSMCASFTPNMAIITDNSKVFDHNAIVPTSRIAYADLNELPVEERNVLLLVNARLLCASAEKHTFEAVAVVLECVGHRFTAMGKMIQRDGWRAIDRVFHTTMGTPDEDGNMILPDLQEGQSLEIITALVHEDNAPLNLTVPLEPCLEQRTVNLHFPSP